MDLFYKGLFLNIKNCCYSSPLAAGSLETCMGLYVNVFVMYAILLYGHASLNGSIDFKDLLFKAQTSYDLDIHFLKYER